MVDYITELYYSGAWNAITSDVRDAEPIAMKRGRRNWTSHADPATCTLKINNGASKVAPGQFGRYSPRNPRSDLYGLIGRNTPIRVRNAVRANDSVWLAGTQGSYLDTADTALLDITGDIDIRVELDPSTWRSDTGTVWPMIAKWPSVNDWAWIFYMRSAGMPRFSWTTDGLESSRVAVSPDALVPADAGRLALRVTLDVDNGSGGSTVRFYTAPGIDGPWTQLGGDVVTPGTTTIWNSSAPLAVGGDSSGSDGFSNGVMMAARYYAAEVRAGIDGPVRCRLDLDGHEPEDRTLTDTDDRTWTLHGAATFTDPSIRFTGECSVWPLEWDLSGADQWVKLQAAGVSRRIDRSKTPLRSSLFRDLSTKPDVVAYWPLEEPQGAIQFTSGLTDDTSALRPLDIAEVDVAADGDTFVASAPLPRVHDTPIFGNVPPYTPAVNQRFIALVAVPREGLASEKLLMRWFTAGSVTRWDLNVSPAGALRLTAYDDADVALSTGFVDFDVNGRALMMSLWLEQRGPDVFWQVSTFRGGVGGATIMEATIPGHTFDRITRVYLGSTHDVEGTTFGHAALINGDVHAIWDVVDNSLAAWSGEQAADRLMRLCADASLPPVHIRGRGADTEAMGPQQRQALMALLREVPTADLGMLGDRQDANGLAYRPRTSLYNQDPRLTLAYTDGVIADPFRPVDDDQHTRNDITVDRVRGSSFSAALTVGRMSTAAPPEGVGVYDYAETVSLHTDNQLRDQVGWRLHLGTIDEARYPTLRLDLHNLRVASLQDQILALTEGDLIRITDLPPQLPPGPLDLLVESIDERKSAVRHTITFGCSPGSAWTVGVWAEDAETPAPDAPRRYDTAGTIRDGLDIDADQTGITLTTTIGPLWTTDPADFPFDILVGGERMRVTAIGAETVGGQQLFTVIRSVNGVVKSHPAGTSVRLADPAVYAL